MMTDELGAMVRRPKGELIGLSAVASVEMMLLLAMLYIGLALVKGWPPSLYLLSKFSEVYAWLCSLGT